MKKLKNGTNVENDGGEDNGFASTVLGGKRPDEETCEEGYSLPLLVSDRLPQIVIPDLGEFLTYLLLATNWPRESSRRPFEQR